MTRGNGIAPESWKRDPLSSVARLPVEAHRHALKCPIVRVASLPSHCIGVRARSVVPTALWTKASGKRPARRCTALQPVQCAGISSAGWSSSKAATVGSMIGSNIGPLRWNPPMTAATCDSPVSRCACRHDVDDPGVATAGQDHESAVGETHHECLVVEDQRVGLPAAVHMCLVSGEARLERRRAIDLARHEHRAVEQEGGLLLLDDLEARALECGAAGRGQLARRRGPGSRSGDAARTRDG